MAALRSMLAFVASLAIFSSCWRRLFVDQLGGRFRRATPRPVGGRVCLVEHRTALLIRVIVHDTLRVLVCVIQLLMRPKPDRSGSGIAMRPEKCVRALKRDVLPNSRSVFSALSLHPRYSAGSAPAQSFPRECSEDIPVIAAIPVTTRAIGDDPSVAHGD